MKNPCKECPFRKDSPPGWIGTHSSAQEIVDIVKHDQYFPCHMKVDYNDPDWKDKITEKPHCVGGLAFMNNSCKVSRDPVIAAMQKDVGRRDDVFSFGHEMVEHHARNKRNSQS